MSDGSTPRDPVVQVLKPGGRVDDKADVVCFLQSDDWTGEAMKAVRSPSRKSVYVIDGRRGGDMSFVFGAVDGVTHLFDPDRDVVKAVLSLWYGWLGLEDDDAGEPGAVPREEFLERLRLASLPASHPDSRDEPGF